MDWNAAIEKNREALERILAMLVAMAGLDLGELRGQFYPDSLETRRTALTLGPRAILLGS